MTHDWSSYLSFLSQTTLKLIFELYVDWSSYLSFLSQTPRKLIFELCVDWSSYLSFLSQTPLKLIFELYVDWSSYLSFLSQTPIFSTTDGSNFSTALLGKVRLSSVCWSPSAKPGNEVECRIYGGWVETHFSLPIWSRLWTKVHVVLRRCRRPLVVLSSHLADCLYDV